MNNKNLFLICIIALIALCAVMNTSESSNFALKYIGGAA